MSSELSFPDNTFPWGQPTFIAIDGPIGVGKSTLARRLSELCNASLILEEPDQNEFLPDFYRNPRRYALHTQLSFLIKRTGQLEAVGQNRLFNRCCIADFTPEKNQIFAQTTLNEAEFQLYRQVQVLLQRHQPKRDLVIYLQASVDTLIDRIIARGINYELNIEAGYLRRLCEAYVEFFHNYEASPLLVINAENINFVEDDDIIAELARKITGLRHGRHYYNPISLNQSLSLD